MSRVTVKVYAAFSPAGPDIAGAVRTACSGAVGNEEWLSLAGDMLSISFEGVYFPLDECLDALRRSLAPEAAGKLDYLDMEAWTLTRCLVEKGEFFLETRGLNHVLEYSGH